MIITGVFVIQIYYVCFILIEMYSKVPVLKKYSNTIAKYLYFHLNTFIKNVFVFVFHIREIARYLYLNTKWKLFDRRSGIKSTLERLTKLDHQRHRLLKLQSLVDKELYYKPLDQLKNIFLFNKVISQLSIHS